MKRAPLLVCLLASVAPAQYTSTVVAGGGPPNGAAATAIAISPAPGVAVDSAGNLYIAAPTQHRVYKVSGGVVTTFAGTGVAGFSGDGGQAAGAQLNSPAAVAVDGSGSVFITDGSNYRIRKVSGGVITTVAGNGSPTAYGDGAPAISAGIGVPGGIAADAGSLYITDTVSCRVRKVSGSLISTLAGTGSCGYSGDGGSAASAQLSAPGAVAVSGSNVYIADSGNYRIRKVAAGVITTFAGTGTMGYAGDGGPAAAAQLSYVQSLATDSLGNLYIGHYSAVRKVTGTTITTVAGGGSGGDGGPATAAKLDSPTGLALDSSRNLFIGDTARVRKVSVANGIITTVAGNAFGSFSGDSGPAANAQISPDALAVDGAGKLYISNPADYRVRMVAGGLISTIAGGGSYGTRGDGGPATGASVNPSAVAADSTGNLYIVDGTTIRKVAGGVITTIAGSDTAAGYSGDGGFARNARIGFAQAIAVDNGGNIYFVDQSRVRKIAAGWISTIAGAGPADGAAASAVSVGSPNVALDSAGYLYIVSSTLHRVFRVAPTGTITTVAGNGTPGFSGDGGPATSAQLAAPAGVAVDSAGNLYIADSGNLRVRKVAGGLISTFAGGGSGCAQQINSFGDNCPPPSAQLGWVNSLAVDSTSNVYIGDGNYRVRKVSGGIISTIAGTGVNGYSGDSGPATSAQIGPAQGLAVDASGTTVYIADAGNSRVRKIAGGTITTVAGTGFPAYSGDGGAATAAQLNFPSGISVDGSGNLYIADTGNSRVRVVSSSGIINTVAGSGTYGYWGDGGAATGAQLKSPSGIAVNSAGTNVYIADRGDFRVRKVTGGLIATFGGNGLQAFSGDGGSAATAQFDSPAGLAIDGAGNIYVADTNNGRIRVIGTDGIVRTFAGGGAEGAASGGLALNAMMRPQRIAVDGGGKLYVIDEAFRLLRRVSGGVVTTVGPLADAGSNAGAAVDAAGGVYVSEPSTGRVLLYRAGCSYSLAPVSGVVPPGGGTGTLAVNASAGCPWTAVSNASWITVTAVSVQSLSYSAAANSTAAQRVGTITIGSQTFTVTQSAGNSAVPSIVAVTPFQGSGAGATFTVQYRDTAGWTALQKLEFLVNPRFETPANGCYVQYTPVDNLLRLYADDGVAVVGALPPGFAGTISNSQCTLSVGSSAATGSGTDVTLGLSLSFKPSFTGQKHLWVRATDFSIPSRTSDWMVFGVWVPGQATARAIEWYRIFDPYSNTYLYSADAYEYQELGRRGFVLQGIAGKVLDGPMSIIAPSGASVPDMVWWRVYVKSNGSHFWTSDRNEYLTLIRSGAYVGEGAAAFVMPYIDAQGSVAPQVTNTIPFYRAAYTAGGDLHFWTADADEYSGRNGKHLPAGYKGEGIAAYVFPVSGADFGQQPPPKLQSAVDDTSPLVVSAISSASLSRGPIAAGESLTILGDRLGGTVRINSVPAQVQSASEHEMRVIVPADLAGATDAAIVVETEGRRSRPIHTRVVRANPAIFASNQYGRGQAQALLEDGTPNGAENPAARGSVVTFFCTGAGLLDLPLAAHVDGYAAEVVSVQASATRAGVVEVKVRIPDVIEPGPDRPITIDVGNFSSQAGVGLAIR